MQKILLSLLLLAGTPSYAQTWFKVAPAAPSIVVTIPAGTIYRYGNVKDDKWSPVTTATSTFTAVNYAVWGGFPFREPDYQPATPSELQVQETNSTQNIKVTDTSVNPAKTTIVVVPSLLTPPPPPPTSTTYTFSCAGTVAGTISISSTGTATLSASTITLTSPCNGVKQ